MITIIKEGQTLKCSKNTYETMYKRLGYEILELKKETIEPEKEPEVKKAEGLEDKQMEKIVMPKEETKARSTRNTRSTRSRIKKGE